MKLLADLSDDALRGKRVLVRAGLDVPIAEGVVAGDFRVKAALPTLRYLAERGACVIIISHIGRDPSETLAPVAAVLNRFLPVSFIPDTLGQAAKDAVAALAPGEIIMLENLRQDPREVGNDQEFARALAALGDLYVNDAFSDCHRAHASIVGIPKLLPSFAGIELADEIAHLAGALTPAAPSLALLAGAKFETKEPLIRKLLQTYDHVFVGGALANDIFRARGLAVGRSRISDGVPSADVLANPRLVAPVDVTVEDANGAVSVVASEAIGAGDRCVDMGPATLALLEKLLKGCAFTLWNGPTGIYEEGFKEMSIDLARAVAGESTESIVGGGDTVTAIADAGLFEKLTFVSTGGGAMLEFLIDGTLPGIDALSASPRA